MQVQGKKSPASSRSELNMEVWSVLSCTFFGHGGQPTGAHSTGGSKEATSAKYMNLSLDGHGSNMNAAKICEM